jgi:hypothetical protein
MEQTFVKSHFKDKLPRTSAAPVVGVYEEENDLQILGSPEDAAIDTSESLDICDIAPFVHSSMKELSRLDIAYTVSKVAFDLDIKGNKVRFTVENKLNVTPS